MTFPPLPIQTHNTMRLCKVMVATTPEELQRIQRLRYEVYVEEEGKTLSCADHTARTLGDSHDEDAIHLYMIEAGEVVACVRLHAGFIPQALTEPLELERFPGCGAGHDCFISKLMVRKNYRGSMTFARLMRAIHAIAEGLGINMMFCTTFPHLVALYGRIGFESYRGVYLDKDFGPHHALAGRLKDFRFQREVLLPRAA